MIASTSPALTAAENLSSSALIDASSSEAATALDGAKQPVVNATAIVPTIAAQRLVVTVCIVSSVIVDCSRATGTLGFTGFRHGAAATKGQVAANIRGTPVSRRTSRRQRQEKNRRWCAQRNASARRLVCVFVQSLCQDRHGCAI
jgi:hypothetical protein